MVARREKDRSKSPCLDVRVELDNRALRAKNSGLTQTVAKLQQENAELVKQLTILQGESFEISSKYNNLKNVISIIDSTTKTCLPKINEVVETFSGIIQLCAVAANISNYCSVASSPTNKDTRTQAVKPHIVNGHVLHNPTITLARLSNTSTYTPPRSSRSSNDAVRPSTSRGFDDNNHDGNRLSNRDQEDDSDSNSEDNQNGNEVQDSSFVCQARRGSRRKQSDSNVNMSRLDREVFEDSDEENEEPVEEEQSDLDQDEQRLTTIHEVEEEEENILNSISPRSRQRRFLQGRLQEVRIYLNQLPNTYIEQFRGSGNISISVSPPERRSSFKHRSSSLVGEVNESVMDNGRLYLEEQISRLSTGEDSFNETSRRNENNSKLSVSFKRPVTVRSPEPFEGSSGSNILEQYTENLSAIRNLQTPSTSTFIQNESNAMQFETLQESTPIVPRLSAGTAMGRSDRYDSPNRSRSDSIVFKNITKRRTSSREKRKVAQVILNRVSLEKRLSDSPIKGIEDVVNVPLIKTSSELRTRLKNGTYTRSSNGKNANSATSDEENVEKMGNSTAKAKKRKKDSPTRKVGDVLVKPKKTSPPKSPVGRPKRAARPKTLKEPNLNKKMRRSK